MKNLFNGFNKQMKVVFISSIITLVFVNVLAYLFAPVLLAYTLSGFICIPPVYKQCVLVSNCIIASKETSKYSVISDVISLIGITISFILSLCLHASIIIILICVVLIIVHVIRIVNAYRLYKGFMKYKNEYEKYKNGENENE